MTNQPSTTPESIPSSPHDWDSRFGDNPNTWFFGREASEMARLALTYWKLAHGDHRSSLIDLGCGEGRDSVFFTQNGFEVTAIDGSEVGLEKTRRLAAEFGLNIHQIIHSDIRDVQPSPDFELFAAHNSLQFIGMDCIPVLHGWQAACPDGGLHSVSAFTTVSHHHANRPDLYRFEPNELKFHYRGWRIYYYGEFELWREPSKAMISFAHVIAQKI